MSLVESRRIILELEDKIDDLELLVIELELQIEEMEAKE